MLIANLHSWAYFPHRHASNGDGRVRIACQDLRLRWSHDMPEIAGPIKSVYVA